MDDASRSKLNEGSTFSQDGESRWLAVVAAVCCIPFWAVGQYAGLIRVDDVDAAFFAYYGQRLLAGQQLYVDLWDNKPPGIFWVDAVGLCLSGGAMWGVAAVVCVATLGTLVLFFSTARRLFGGAAACIGAILASLYVFQFSYHVGANRPSTFFVFFEIAVLYTYVRGMMADGAWRWYVATGVFAACAVCFRQTAFAVSGAIVVHQTYLLIARRISLREVLRWAASYTAGVLATFVVVVFILYLTSDLSWAYHGVVLSNVGYVTVSKQSSLIPAEVFHWREHVRIIGLPVILGAAGVIHTVALRLMTRRQAAEHESRWSKPGVSGALVLLVAWLPIALYLALVGPHAARHYYGLALPALVMLATYGVWIFVRREVSRDIPRYYVIVIVLWFGYMAYPIAELQVKSAMIQRFHRFENVADDRWSSTVRAIESHTDREDRLFSPAYLPFVYQRTNRPQAHRYLLETLIDQWKANAQPYVDEVVRDLKVDPPEIIVLSRKQMRDMDEKAARLYVDYGDFAEWVRANYSLVNKDDGENVWVLNRDNGATDVNDS